MIITKKHLSRRTFLRGTFGAAVALPLLDAMVPALTAQSRAGRRRSASASSTCRAASIRTPGIRTQIGSNFDFKPVMQPLEPFRDQLVTISKMKAPWGESVHVGASSAFLNGVGPMCRARGDRRLRSTSCGRRRRSTSTSPTRSAGDTPLRSIEVGTEDMGTAAGACDGFPCTLFETLAWREDTRPLPVSINPRVTFERMFGETGSPEHRAARLKEKQSLLDSVTQETTKLRRTLGAPDRAILDEYLSNIRQVEQQLDRMETRLGTITGNPESPIGLPEAFDDHMT